MPVINRISAYADDMKAWRQQLHAHPELGFECHRTAEFVAARLSAFGVNEIHKGIATSGIVAIIEGRGDGPTIGLRADMDALPILEETWQEYASQEPGKMHACGHDGHTTMLLGAARYLAETRNFRGRVALIFQPAEEAGGGADVMCKEGIMDRFEIAEVYALHVSPELGAGHFLTCPGPIMAAVDDFDIYISGSGGHGAYPDQTCDPVAAALQIGNALQTIVSRNVSGIDNLVVSVTQIHTGSTHNVIPAEARLGGTVRTFRTGIQKMVQKRMEDICHGIGAAMGVDVRLDYKVHYPATVNHPEKVSTAVEIAREIAGADNVVADAQPEMGAEDFSFMLEQRPGAYLFVGQGEGPFLHSPAFDFNDEIAPVGASFFARLVERMQPLD